jgi:glycosyltransferase involved in cell wall biosynthesis
MSLAAAPYLSRHDTVVPGLVPAREGARRAPLVLIFTDDPERGGVAQYNHALLLALAETGLRAACAQAPSESPLIETQRAAGVEHHWLPYDARGADFSVSLTDMATPRAIFEATRPALIVFSDCCPVSNLAAKHAAMAMRIPFVVVVGFAAEYLVEQSRDFLGVIRRHYASARALIAVSEENLQLLRGRFGLAPNKGTVIHYGRPAAFFSPGDPALRQRMRAELGIPEAAVVALTAARLASIKGHQYQIAAIEELDRRGALANNHFVWLGEGEQRAALEREIRRHHWEDRITLAGHRWNMPDWYDISDLYILASENEGMPLSIMEAMAKSLPVIATAISGIPEELGPTGKLLPDPKVRRGDAVHELARTIDLWTRNAALRRQIGAACRQRAELLFREETMLEKTLAIVVEALATADGTNPGKNACIR